jgi:hypothetical protein
MNRRSWIITGIAVALLAPLSGAIGIVEAQDDPAAKTDLSEGDVAVGEFVFTTDPKEPFQASIVQRSTNSDGSFVTWVAAAQMPDGSFTGLTACDNVAVICAPLISPAKAGFRLADPGDHIFLANEVRP